MRGKEDQHSHRTPHPLFGAVMDWGFGDPALIDPAVVVPPSPFAPVVNGQKRLARLPNEDIPSGKRCRLVGEAVHQFVPMAMQLEQASPFAASGLVFGSPFAPQQPAPTPAVTQPPSAEMVLMGAKRCPPCFAHRFCRGSQCAVQVPMPLSCAAYSFSERQQDEAMQM